VCKQEVGQLLMSVSPQNLYCFLFLVLQQKQDLNTVLPKCLSIDQDMQMILGVPIRNIESALNKDKTNKGALSDLADPIH
jgi:hypothetical protein